MRRRRTADKANRLDYLRAIQRVDEANLKLLLSTVESAADARAAVNCHEQFGVGPVTLDYCQMVATSKAVEIERAKAHYLEGLARTQAKIAEYGIAPAPLSCSPPFPFV